jgi:hypothetical protein
MPRQWKLIALYMVAAYLAFVVAIHIARREVDKEASAPSTTQRTD